jgi:chemotaxis protein CheY-P-specific phosphatase CheC
MESFAIAKDEFKPIFEIINQIAGTAIPALETQLEKYKAPYTPGRALKMMQGQ